jgi:hypothetical protein
LPLVVNGSSRFPALTQRPPPQSADSRQGLLQKSGKVFVHRPCDSVGFVVTAGEHYRDAGSYGAQKIERLFTVHYRHGEVENHKGDASVLFLEKIDPRLTVFRRQNLKATLLKRGTGCLANYVFIIGYQDGLRSASPECGHPAGRNPGSPAGLGQVRRPNVGLEEMTS